MKKRGGLGLKKIDGTRTCPIAILGKKSDEFGKKIDGRVYSAVGNKKSIVGVKKA
jgi:hypothetical protein